MRVKHQADVKLLMVLFENLLDLTLTEHRHDWLGDDFWFLVHFIMKHLTSLHVDLRHS